MDKEFVIPVVVGFGDGISDAGIKYLDKVAGTEKNPVLKRASTWAHIGIGVVSAVASYMYLKGNARLMGAMIAGRHFGKVAGDIVENGIVLTGGGALIRGLDKYLSDAVKLPVYIAEDPLLAVAKGTGKVLDELDLLQQTAFDE